MNEGLITVRYAKAFYELAAEEKVLDTVRQDMNSILSLAREVEDFRFFLDSPLIKSDEKKKIFTKLFKDSVQEVTLRLLSLLVEHKRENYLEGICRNFLSHYKAEMGIKEASITTAFEIPEEIKEHIHAFVTKYFNAKIELNQRVAPSIIRGFVLRVEDQQINASIASQLNKIKRELINS